MSEDAEWIDIPTNEKKGEVSELRYLLSPELLEITWMGCSPFNYPVALDFFGSNKEQVSGFLSSRTVEQSAMLNILIAFCVGGICEQAAKFVIDHSVAIDKLQFGRDKLLLFMRREQDLRELVKGSLISPVKTLVPPDGSMIWMDEVIDEARAFLFGWQTAEYRVFTQLSGKHAEQAHELFECGNSDFNANLCLATGSMGAAAEATILILGDFFRHAQALRRATLRGNLLDFLEMVNTATIMSQETKQTSPLVLQEQRFVVPTARLWVP